MTREWDADDQIHPIKGPKGDTTFLKDNYKTMGIGSSFRTPKARFTPKQIHAGASKAGFRVQILEEGPWLKVIVTGKLPSSSKLKPSPTPKKQTVYTGAGKVYPPTNNEATTTPDIFS